MTQEFDLNNYTKGRTKNVLGKANEPLNKALRTYVTETEKERFDELANSEGLKPSIFLRHILKKAGLI